MPLMTYALSVLDQSPLPAGGTSADESLFEKLRELRRTFADQHNVPAYIVFSDAALRDMAVRKPTTEKDFLEVSGVGEKKLADFGEAFLDLIRQHLRD